MLPAHHDDRVTGTGLAVMGGIALYRMQRMQEAQMAEQRQMWWLALSPQQQQWVMAQLAAEQHAEWTARQLQREAVAARRAAQNAWAKEHWRGILTFFAIFAVLCGTVVLTMAAIARTAHPQ